MNEKDYQDAKENEKLRQKFVRSISLEDKARYIRKVSYKNTGINYNFLGREEIIEDFE